MIKISPKAFFFDFDGVICDSERAHMISALKVLREHNVDFSEDYYFEKLFGFDDRALFEHVFNLHGKEITPATLKQLLKDKNTEFMQILEDELLYFDGVVDLIKRIHERNIPIAVVSGALESEVLASLAKGKIDTYFKFVICADHVNSCKPDPEGYEIAFEEMLSYVNNLNKDDCWVLEDSPAGLSAATEAGLNTIAITNSAPANRLKANHIVKHYSEIIID